ncbi:uncharacterized protein LOC131654179 [Vicia villosa]|uniref:uncharacterized protein LOC131654179 n=1 Tax=Vicia villosa TaxID=3911 RepID=UPI00273C6172|nr:uncharacterized protein LOC131654179 [Vicia villosa]
MSASFSNSQVADINLRKAIIDVPSSLNANLGSKESQTSHAPSSEGPSVYKGNSSNPVLDKFREGSRYVDEAISRLVNRVLREDIPVAGITRPLAQIVPPTIIEEKEQSPMINSSNTNDSNNNLHKIGAINWVPTNHTSKVAVGLGKYLYVVGTRTNFDYGTYIFYQIVRHTSTNATKMPVAFPSLICGVVISQHPGILLGTDMACKRESSLSLHEKLFAGKHVANLILTSTEKRLPATGDTIIALEDICKDLDKIISTSTMRKLDIEKLIKSLEQAEKIGTSTTTKEADDAQNSNDYVEGNTTASDSDDGDYVSSSDEEE